MRHRTLRVVLWAIGSVLALYATIVAAWTFRWAEWAVTAGYVALVTAAWFVLVSTPSRRRTFTALGCLSLLVAAFALVAPSSVVYGFIDEQVYDCGSPVQPGHPTPLSPTARSSETRPIPISMIRSDCRTRRHHAVLAAAVTGTIGAILISAAFLGTRRSTNHRPRFSAPDAVASA